MKHPERMSKSAKPQEVLIEKVVFGGDGLCRVDGKVCFVEQTIQGEKVLIEVTDHRKNFSNGKVLQVLTPSPLRKIPPCSLYGICGGCQYQHMEYAEELRTKEMQVREALERGLKLSQDGIRPILHEESPYGYRNRVTLHPARDRASGQHYLGYISRDNHTTLKVSACPLADPRFECVFSMPASHGLSHDRMTFSLSEEGSVISSQANEFFKVRVGERSFWTHSRGFFQNHLQIAAKMVNTLSGWVSQAQPQVFLDMYAGAGLFGILAAGEVPERIFMEENFVSLDALRRNLGDTPQDSFRILQGRVEERLSEELSGRTLHQAMMVLDPPRTGLEPGVARFLSERQDLDHLVYISCDLAILVRDLKILLEKGHYQICEVQPFDMFPRTKHIETAVLLAKSQ